MEKIIMYYLATVLKANNEIVPMAKVISVDVAEDPKEIANNGKRKFMNMILEELEEGDLIVGVQSNLLDVKEEDIIL